MPKNLYTYQCPTCKATLTVTVKAVGTGRPYQCKCSGSWMKLLFEEPIVDDADRALAQVCPVWQSPGVSQRIKTNG